MSYILDALKKSDQQRDLGTTPDLHSVHEPPQGEPPRRPGWLYGLAVVLLLNAGVLGWWLWPEDTSKTPVAQLPEKAGGTEPPQLTTASSATLFNPSRRPAKTAIPPLPSTAPPVAKTGAPASMPVAPPTPPAIPASTPPPPPPPQMTQPMAQLGSTPAIQPAAVQAEANKPPVIAPPPSPPADKAKAVAVTPKKPPAPPQAAAPAQKPMPVAVVPVPTATEPAASQEDEPLDEIEPQADAAEETETATSAEPGETLAPIAATAAPKKKSKIKDGENEDPELAKIPLLNQLPAEIQQAVPELHISFHSYSIKPSARLVSISGKILREGGSFDEEVKLVTITKQGVVMSVKDRPFRLKVNPSARE